VRSLVGDSSRSSPYQSARLTSAKIARTCEDYARKWRYQNVTLAGLCEASGVSERRVRSAFYECYQMSPTAYLRVTALNAVRRELVQGPGLRGAVSLLNIGRYSASHPDTPLAIGRIDPRQPQTELRSRRGVDPAT
jgi:methylphosphotriester-DNA--protein-cysteine methyltransferase